MSKEMWEECQVQKRKNQKSYQRSLTYLYLQKLKCPKCNRLLGGKATTKKNGRSYYYYYCNDCKIEFKESKITDYFNNFITELLEKEIKKQKEKLERIKKAYINGAFNLKEYNEEKKIVEKSIKQLKSELNTTENVEELRFTPKDILLKRDIDYINKVKLKDENNSRKKTWKEYTREEQADLIMKYIDNIELSLVGTEIIVKNINFRDSICKPYKELYLNGYIDEEKPTLFRNVLGSIRFSNYLPDDEVGEIYRQIILGRNNECYKKSSRRNCV